MFAEELFDETPGTVRVHTLDEIHLLSRLVRTPSPSPPSPTSCQKAPSKLAEIII